MKSIIIIFIVFYLNFINSQNFKLCENGGVFINNSLTICPFGFNGTNCEYKIKNEICNQAIHYGVPFDSLCCWQKYRTDSNLTEMKITTSKNNEKKSVNDKIIEIFKTYGPWRERDIHLANLLIEKDNNNNEFYLKYSNNNNNNFIHKNLNNNFNNNNKFPFSCDDIENPNPIAFSIMIHKINLNSIDQLLQILYKPYHYYVIHVDKSITDINLLLKLKEYLEFFEYFKKEEFGGNYKNYPSNIKLMSERFIGAWGSISLIYMELATYTELFDMVKNRSLTTNDFTQWSHVINLSLNDMPTIPISNLSKLLCENYNTNYLDENCLKEYDRFNKTYLDYEKGISVFEPFSIEDSIFEKYQCGKTGMINYYDRSDSSDGSQWHSLTASFARYLISDIKSIERLFSFKFSNIPDESFYQASKKYYTNLNNDIFTKESHRVTMWENNPNRADKYRYGVFLKDVDKIKKGTLFIRKVYTSDVKEAIIKKFNLIE